MSTGRYVPKDFQRWLHSVGGCAWCGRGGSVQDDGSHREATCLACGAPQCSQRPTCAACLHGWLPGWSRGYVWDGNRNVANLCGYKGCEREAVANAPRVHRVCAEHLSRAKERGMTLAQIIADNRADAIDHAGGHFKQWRHLVWRAAVGHEDDGPPELPAIPGVERLPA